MMGLGLNFVTQGFAGRGRAAAGNALRGGTVGKSGGAAREGDPVDADALAAF